MPAFLLRSRTPPTHSSMAALPAAAMSGVPAPARSMSACRLCTKFPAMILTCAVLVCLHQQQPHHPPLLPFVDAFAYNQLPSETTRYLCSLDRNTSAGGVFSGSVSSSGSSSGAGTALHLAAEVGSSSSSQPAAPIRSTSANNKSKAQEQDKKLDPASSKSSSSSAPKQSLYDVLRCPPTATKTELKKQYVLLAKQTHPDAQIGRTPEQIAAMEADPLIPSFHQVSEAWKTLSDDKERKRYDRSLKADEFVESAEKWAATISESTGSILSETWQSQLSPFIKRTVSTVNNANAAFREELGESTTAETEDVSSRAKAARTVGVGQYWKAAVEAARQAGRSISQQDMYEKAAELDERAQNEMKQANAVREELAAIMERRLNMSLQTPGSKLSSLEAQQIFDGLNFDDKRSITDFVQLRKTVTSEIEALEKVEASYYMKYDEREEAERGFQISTQALEQSRINAESARKAEERALQALKAAQELVESTKKAVQEQTDNFAESEVEFLRRVEESEKLSAALSRRQERVRAALARKERALVEDNFDGAEPIEGVETECYLSESEIECNQRNLEELKKKESFLLAEGSRLEQRAMRLQSRSDKLKARAEFIDREER